MIKPLGRKRDERGAILILATIGIVLAIICAGLAVDLGRQAQEARRNQKVADLAALDAVRALPNDPTPAGFQSATRNEFRYDAPGNSLLIEPGTVDADHNFTPGPLATANAVRATVQSLLKDDFLPGDHTVVRRGVATLGNGNGCFLPNNCVMSDGNPLGTVRVGSKLASASGPSVPPTTVRILDKFLASTVGGTYTLDAIGWKGLADGNVTFKRLQTALGITAGSADQVLASQFTFRQLLDATIGALNADGSPSSATAATRLGTIASQVSPSAGSNMSLGQLFAIQGSVGSGVDVANATMNVADLVTGGAIIADTDHFASMDLSVADVGAIPGVNSVKVKMGLIEAPVTNHGAPKDANGVYRTIAKTSQIRVQVEMNMSLTLAGVGLVDIVVPYYLNAGSAEALLDTLHCTAGIAKPTSVDILGRTTAGSSNLGTVSNANLSNPTVPVPGPAQLINVLGLITVSTNGVATTTISGNSGTMLNFTPEYTADAPSKPVPGTALTLPSLLTGNLTVGGSLVATLNANAIKLDLANGVNAALPGLTTQVLQPLYQALGLSFAGADVWAPPVQDCQPTSYNILPPPQPAVGIPTLVK